LVERVQEIPVRDVQGLGLVEDLRKIVVVDDSAGWQRRRFGLGRLL
jgi:hypothetical protein